VKAGNRSASGEMLNRLTRFLDGYPQWVRFPLSVIVVAVLSVALGLAQGESFGRALVDALVFAALFSVVMAFYWGWRPWHRRS